MGARCSIIVFVLFCSIGIGSNALAQTADTDALFQSHRWHELVATLITVAALWFARQWLRKRGRPRLRPLPPMEAIDDAVGRATEQGTPIVYTTGWGGDMARPTTMASMEILSIVAQRAAAHNCRLMMPSHDPVIVSVAQDTVYQSASVQGRPDWFRSDDVSFVTQSQFGYASAFGGMVARHDPGAVFLLGTFEGEALILAEAAHLSGSVTIAGTDSTIQLSFFLVACDYTLIGEELFAAAGVASNDDASLSAVWAQDLLKFVILALLCVGAVLIPFGIDLGRALSR